MAEELKAAQDLLASRDLPGLLRHLRTGGEALSLSEVASVIAQAAYLAGFDDLARAAALADGADGSAEQDPQLLFDFGYALVERGVGFLAIRPLARALELAPDSGPVLSELVAALAQEGRHSQAVAVLEEHEPVLRRPHRFQYAYNALLAGDLGKAYAGLARLPEPQDDTGRRARDKVQRMVARADAARAVTSLDARDLRGWHYALAGSILAGLSPYGWDDMNGRYGYLADSVRGCAAALARLRLILGAAAIRPDAVVLLPDRSSRILGAAAAALLGVPAADFDPARPAANCLVVAYDLTQADPDAVAALRAREPGQVLFERATCWTDPPPVTADISGLLAQVIDPPWAGHLEVLPDGTAGQGPPDDRPVEAIAAAIAAAEPEHDEGDGAAPPDRDQELGRFAEAVAGPAARGWDGGWLGGLREYVPHAGPVPSSRFW